MGKERESERNQRKATEAPFLGDLAVGKRGGYLKVQKDYEKEDGSGHQTTSAGENRKNNEEFEQE